MNGLDKQCLYFNKLLNILELWKSELTASTFVLFASFFASFSDREGSLSGASGSRRSLFLVLDNGSGDAVEQLWNVQPSLGRGLEEV